MNQIGDLKLVALSGAEAEFTSEAIQVLGVRSWVLAKQIILDMQEVKRILQRRTAASGVLPIQQSWRTVRSVLNVPGCEVAVDPEGGQQMRSAQLRESCGYGRKIAVRT